MSYPVDLLLQVLLHILVPGIFIAIPGWKEKTLLKLTRLKYCIMGPFLSASALMIITMPTDFYISVPAPFLSMIFLLLYSEKIYKFLYTMKK